MSSGPSFIGFAPEEKAKAMDTLTKVIELKDKNRAAAEESRGFEIAEEEKYAKRYKPIVDAISTASGEILKYTNEKDVKFAAKEVIDAVSQLKTAKAQAAAEPANQGYAALVPAYRAQAMFAQSKMNFLEEAEKYGKAAAGNPRQVALAALQKARDDYADSLSAFQKIQIPIGFKQTVSIQQPPPKGSVFPGANLEISPSPTIAAPAPPGLVAKVPTGPPPPPPAPKLVAKPKGGPAPPPPTPVPTPSPPTGGPSPPPAPVPKQKKSIGQKIVKALFSPTTSQTFTPSHKDKWAYDLLQMRTKSKAIPQEYRKASIAAEFVPGSIAIVSLPKRDGDDVKVRMMDATGASTVDGEISDRGGILQYDFADINGNQVSGFIDNDFENLMLVVPKPFNKHNIWSMIMLHAKVFGGWGVNFWNMNPGDKYDFMNKIMKNKSYKEAVADATIHGSVHKTHPIGEGTLKFKTSATPKASVMRLGPEGEYGNLIIDVRALYNDGKLIARERGDQYGSNLSAGAIKLNEAATPGIKNLITKRAMQTTINKSSPATQKQLKRLRKMAGFIPPKTKTTKGAGTKSDSGVIVVGDANDIIERLKVACGVFDAGNRSKKNAQLISELASKLMELNAISESEYAKILEKYKVA